MKSSATLGGRLFNSVDEAVTYVGNRAEAAPKGVAFACKIGCCCVEGLDRELLIDLLHWHPDTVDSIRERSPVHFSIGKSERTDEHVFCAHFDDGLCIDFDFHTPILAAFIDDRVDEFLDMLFASLVARPA